MNVSDNALLGSTILFNQGIPPGYYVSIVWGPKGRWFSFRANALIEDRSVWVRIRITGVYLG